MMLNITTGNCNYPTGSSKVHVFVVPTRQFPGKEANIGMLFKEVQPAFSAIRRINSTIVPAAPALAPTDAGKWTQSTYDVPEGLVLKVFGMTTSQGMQMRRMGNVLIRMRTGGALNRLAAVLAQHPKATLTRATIEGRFDILSLEQAEGLGVRVPPQYRMHFEDVHWRRMFNLEQVEAQIEAPPRVEVRRIENSEGQTVAVAVASRNRMLDI